MKSIIVCLGIISISVTLAHAQPVAAPSPDRPGAEQGVDVGAYNWSNWFEFGYRFSQVGGDENLFRSTENYGNGVRLFGSSITAHSKTGHGFLFDSLSFTTQGLGGDAYGTARLRVEKNERYVYEASWRESDYLNASLDNAESGTLKNTRHTMQDHDLNIRLKDWAHLKLGYSRNRENGPEYTNYELYIGGLARSVLPIDRNARRDWNEYRLGAQFDFLGFRFNLQHQWDYAKDDSSYASLVPGQPYPLANLLNQPYQPSLPVTYPTLATAYWRSAPMHIRTPGWFANLAKNTKLFAMNVRGAYNKSDQTSDYDEVETGARAVATVLPPYAGAVACSNCGAGAPGTAATFSAGTARQAFTSGDLTLSFFPTDRLTITNSTSAQNNHYDGIAQIFQPSTVAATKNVLWDRRQVEGRVSDSLEANYRLTKWLGLASEYRYTERWLDYDLFRTGTTNNTDLNSLSNHLHLGTIGVRLKPVQPLSISLDAGIGRDNSPETPVAPAHFHTVKGRVQYRQKRLTLTGTYRQQYNLNAPQPVVFTSTYGVPPNSFYASHSRDYSVTASFEVRRHLALDVSYSKSHLDTLANMWVEEPANATTVVSVPGYVSEYISNIHTVSIMSRVSFKDRLTFYAGYNITHDAGDGRNAQNLGIQDPAGAFLAATQTFPMTYQAPLIRVSFRITSKLQWNAGWEFYLFNQQFAFFGYLPYYRAQTGYTSLSYSF